MLQDTPPYVFDEFFASGKEEVISPFLTKNSRKWSANLKLKSSLLAAFLLIISFFLSSTCIPVSDFLLLTVYFLVGTPALIDTLNDLKSLEINIDVLMTLAALLSILIGSGFEGALLLVLFELSASMENAVTMKTKGALSSLSHLSPQKAFFINSSGEVWERSVKDIKVGSTILVKAGEIIPLDAKVIQGYSQVNLSHLTGESIPITKRPGDEVPAGARNLDGSLTLEVVRTSYDSTLTRIIQLITHAQEAKPKLQKLIDKLGDKYAILIMSIALLFALLLPLFFSSIPFLGNEGSIYRALTFLIAASPCALVIATPTAYLSSISSCAKKGILLKGGIVLDAISSCKRIAFDKTGTLTSGILKCSSFTPILSEIDTDLGLAMAASVEQHVVHPIATAFIDFAQIKNLSLPAIDQFKATPGFGVEAFCTLDEKKYKIFIGHYEYVSSHFSEALQKKMNLLTFNKALPNQVFSFVLIGENVFVATFSDEVKTESLSTIQYLQNQLHMDAAMLTGDHHENAEAVGSFLGITKVYSNLRPEDKLKIVSDLSSKKGLIMVGDGVNDAPALMRATVGVSMGKIGSATAIDASDVVFLQDDLSSLTWLIRKAHKTMSIIKQNLSLALGVILLATSPAILGFVPLWMAVVLHEGGTVLVGLNSLRLLKK